MEGRGEKEESRRWQRDKEQINQELPKVFLANISKFIFIGNTFYTSATLRREAQQCTESSFCGHED